ncbi:ubiquinone biosynthesis regulatory protein kinase UbiB [Agaribacterium haliotis]|uniref:ubiquinone biosynthesis regulatory protein kinase UbiB n=1 Tax=Agaribacterium haliotis TaxID=2013869 RepID=UPI000BB54B78|nr:ubiquinone biosynthesis regulatory protein kinase UbiB [Agaribacterium haliotis]
MSSLLRLLRIAFCLGKYRLIDLLPLKAPWHWRLLLWPLLLFPKHKAERAVRLRMALEELGPIFIKFGQLLSTRPDLLPADLVLELSKLQDQVAPFEQQRFKQLVEQALGADIDDLFDDYKHEVLASASIAQVHEAKLKNGREIVIKVVRPGIQATIERDTRLLAQLAHWLERFSSEARRLRPVEVVADYRMTVLDELDLMKEAANASQLRRNFENSDKLYIPEVYWDFCRSNVLVIERIDGIPVNDLEQINAQSTNLKLLAERGVEVFFTQVFEHNFFHADMHPGNVFVSRKNPEHNPSYIGIDCAICGSLSREDQYYLARNLIAMFRRDYRQVAELHISSGWVPADTSAGAFESAIRAVCEPLFQKPLQEISFGEALISLFRTAQRFNMPVQPQLVLLQKTLLNIEGLGRQLYPELDLWQTAHPFLEKWLKKRYSLRTLYKELKYNAPEWLEQAPNLPALTINSMNKIQSLADIAPELRHFSDELNKSRRRQKKQRLGLSALLFTAAGASYFFLPGQFELNRELTSLGLATLAFLAMLR